MSQNKPKDFINYWIFLGIPMNSPLSDIKKAYYNKFMEIEKSLDSQENKYTPNDLIIANKAYATLSDPYQRFLHNCQIDGEDPSDIFDYEPDHANEEDLPPEQNEFFLAWLRSKMDEYFAISNNKSNQPSTITWNVERVVFRDIAIGLAENYVKLKENIEKKQRKNKRSLHL